MTAPVPHPGILDITPYVGGQSAIPGVDRVIKLASNEGALGPSPSAVAALCDSAAAVHRYPDGECGALRDALANHYGLDAAQIVCGAGSDEIIGFLARAYAGPGDEVLYTQHGFLMYAIAAKAAGATPVTAPETNLTADMDALLDAVTPRTRIVFLANPNNPTGSYLPATELARLREGLRDDVLLVIDAAYAEYMSRNDYEPGIALVNGGANVVMTRTFSKIFALSGARLGWAYCPPAIADVINRVRNPFNVAAPSQAAGIAALSDVAFADRSRAHNDRVLTWTTERLQALGLSVPPSFGNFILVRFSEEPGRDAASADAFLRSRGIIVRRMAGYGLPESLRITIGLDDEMQAVVDALAKFLG